MPGQEDRLLRFADFVMDRDALELRRHGIRIPLQMQPFRLLEALIEQPGRVVTRDALRHRIWPVKVYVDFDHGLNNAVARLREALDDSADHPRYIETLPRVGYRFIFPADKVVAVTSPPSEPGQARASGGSESDSHSLPARRRAPLYAAGATVIVVALTSFSMHEPDGGVGSHTPPADIERSASVAASGNIEAFQLYEQGRHLWNQRSPDSVKRSVTFFEDAIRLDPTFAAAYAGLAESYSLLGGASLVNVHQVEDLRGPAVAAAARALELDDRLPEAHSAMARALDMGIFRDSWNSVEEHYLQALRLRPAFSDARLGYGNFLSRRGRQDEAITQFREALLYDPVSPNINSRLGKELVSAGLVEEGVALMERAVELAPWQFNARIRLAWNYALLGRFDDADGSFDIASQVVPGNIHVQAGRGYLAAMRGDFSRAAELLDDVESRPEALENPFPIAMIHVAMRDREGSLEWLGKAVAQPVADLRNGYFRLDGPTYDWLREDPRFLRIAMAVAE